MRNRHLRAAAASVQLGGMSFTSAATAFVTATSSRHGAVAVNNNRANNNANRWRARA